MEDHEKTSAETGQPHMSLQSSDKKEQECSGQCVEDEANAAKRHAALSSVLWAALLTVLKLVAGISTNSLGMLSEALHSTLDFVAAGITLFAVRLASAPADRRHPFGHGKVENPLLRKRSCFSSPAYGLSGRRWTGCCSRQIPWSRAGGPSG